MVLLIFEGCDNVGKTTLIDKFVQEFRNTRDIVLIHSRGPEKNSPDPFEYQKSFFKALTHKIVDIANFERYYPQTNKHIVLLDRSWYGEYVYGQIYRNEDPNKIMNEIIDLCNFTINLYKIPSVDVYLKASPEFILAQDDGLSLSSDKQYQNKLNLVERELSLFSECFADISLFGAERPFVKIDVEDSGKFKNIDELYTHLKDTISIRHKIVF